MARDKDLVCGVRAVSEALRSGRHVEKLLLKRDAGGAALRQLKELARQRGVPWQPVPAEKLDRLTRTEHQGVIALLSPVEEQDLGETIGRVYESGGTPLIVALDGVTDVRNLGAIARSAECFGAHALLVPKQGTARLGGDAVKASAGALLREPVCRVERLQDGLRLARDHGLRIVALTEKGDVPLPEANLSGPLVLVLGAEGEGISAPVLRLADQLVRIPLSGGIGSLNVSVAAGVALHEVMRRR